MSHDRDAGQAAGVESSAMPRTRSPLETASGCMGRTHRARRSDRVVTPSRV
ncbi:Hypothetical protein A7982_09061 [Minicystis rosea]|nr:Hypothetical protein A7982_09061 [Minicystis rosea]